MASKPSRERGKNYTEEDKQLIKNLVEAKKYIIECKLTNRKTNEDKHLAWLEITKQFNAISTVPREMHQIKHFYENLKRRMRAKQNGNSNGMLQMTDDSGGSENQEYFVPEVKLEHDIFETFNSEESFCEDSKLIEDDLTNCEMTNDNTAIPRKRKKQRKRVLSKFSLILMKKKLLFQKLKNSQLQHRILELDFKLKLKEFEEKTK